MRDLGDVDLPGGDFNLGVVGLGVGKGRSLGQGVVGLGLGLDDVQMQVSP